MTDIVGFQLRELAWTLDGRGAARGRTERAGIGLEVRTETGLLGRGEASPLPGMSVETLSAAHDALRAFVARGSFTLASEQTVFTLAETIESPSARFAVETALLDVLAQVRGTSIAGLFADDAPSPTTAFDAAVARMRAIVDGDPAITLVVERGPASATVVDDAIDAAAAVRAGARCLKIKIGDLAIDDDVARVRAIAEAAPGTTLRLDANRRWSRGHAIANLARFADLPIDLVEEPCPGAHELLREALPLPIALDESLDELSTDEIFAALESPHLGALILKPTLLGGFAPCIALAALARFANKPAIVTHTLESEVGRAACAELARIVGRVAHVASTGAPVVEQAAISSTTVVIATPELASVATAWRALATRTPIALVHHALPPAEIARRRQLVEAATLADDDAVVLFTSGSTADARGVVLSRAALAAAASASAQHLGWRDDDVWFVPLSLAHAGGLAAIVRCWYARKPLELLDGDWDRARAAALLERCTLASLVPTQLADLLADPAWRPSPRLRAVLLGGAAASRSLLAEAAARGVPFLVTYGMTESFGQLATAALDRAGVPDAPLIPLPGVELIAGTRDAPAPIRVRAPMLATRYLDGAPIAPELVTRDLGYLEAGALIVVGRADDVIITGGENVHPATVEAVLAATPGVRAAIAFAVPDERWGQIVGAAVVSERELGPAVLAAWHAALPAHARPRELAVVRELPLLATGKLDRRAASLLPRSPVRYH